MYKDDLFDSIVIRMIVPIIILFIMYAFVHTPSKNWNSGVCPNCGVEYELKAVNGKMCQEFWQCPVCKEIATK